MDRDKTADQAAEPTTERDAERIGLAPATEDAPVTPDETCDARAARGEDSPTTTGEAAPNLGDDIASI